MSRLLRASARLASPLAVLLLLGCETTPTVQPSAEPTPETTLLSSRGDLRLKRWRQLSRDLEGALVLPEDGLCREVGRFDCTWVHGLSLGGISVQNSVFEPNEEGSVTTGLAIERLALTACNERYQLDQSARAEGGEALVFALDGDATALPDDADALITDLYRRLLARDPEPTEVEALRAHYDTLAEVGGDAGAWAVMSCTAIATTTEALLY